VKGKRDAPWPAMMGLSKVQHYISNEASRKCDPLMPQRSKWWFDRYAQLYMWASMPVARRQEVSADALAARLVQEISEARGETRLTGAESTAQMLRIVHVLDYPKPGRTSSPAFWNRCAGSSACPTSPSAHSAR
jgi:hypothetical protein